MQKQRIGLETSPVKSLLLFRFLMGMVRDFSFYGQCDVCVQETDTLFDRTLTGVSRFLPVPDCWILLEIDRIMLA